ncbi:protein MHF2 homolog isoform X2 [Cicer arietinum]|uniref:protein MHF2 homolog isoform X2 n=1 Tax=Cicer arietinum TaxID=3827 RepID=UPI003CC6B276
MFLFFFGDLLISNANYIWFPSFLLTMCCVILFYCCAHLQHLVAGRIFQFQSLYRVGAGSSKKNRTTSANASALKLTCELLRVFITEAVQRAVAIAEAEGDTQIEATHLESILPQLLLDF